ncbi:unnamed protein product [Acanthosepion pharaonis]|uniref:Uncharacterized protein n=1 Tax=Acanthosepion pharaonis TaxID=158019 RepID=A0A812ELC4_ACAPH|nr:unnamed protein product [Sepia pharaonis]
MYSFSICHSFMCSFFLSLPLMCPFLSVSHECVHSLFISLMRSLLFSLLCHFLSISLCVPSFLSHVSLLSLSNVPFNISLMYSFSICHSFYVFILFLSLSLMCPFLSVSHECVHSLFISYEVPSFLSSVSLLYLFLYVRPFFSLSCVLLLFLMCPSTSLSCIPSLSVTLLCVHSLSLPPPYVSLFYPSHTNVSILYFLSLMRSLHSLSSVSLLYLSLYASLLSLSHVSLRSLSNVPFNISLMYSFSICLFMCSFSFSPSPLCVPFLSVSHEFVHSIYLSYEVPSFSLFCVTSYLFLYASLLFSLSCVPFSLSNVPFNISLMYSFSICLFMCSFSFSPPPYVSLFYPSHTNVSILYLSLMRSFFSLFCVTSLSISLCVPSFSLSCVPSLSF